MWRYTVVLWEQMGGVSMLISLVISATQHRDIFDIVLFLHTLLIMLVQFLNFFELNLGPNFTDWTFKAIGSSTTSCRAV